MNIFLLSFQIVAIILILFFGYLGFGLFLLKKIKINLSNAEKGIVGIITSISLVTAIIALFGEFIGMSAYFFLVPVFILGIKEFKQVTILIKNLFKAIKQNIFGSLLFLCLVSLFTSTIIFSFFKNDGSLVLQEVHDSVWHVALIENLQETLPPKHPSSDTVLLNNYHYFYDLFLSGLGKITKISNLILYFQVSVVFLSMSLVASAFVFGKKIKNNFTGYLLAVTTILFGSLSYLIPVFFHPEQPWGESSFWVSQTFVMIVNPQVIYTLTVTYIVLLLISYLDKFKSITDTNKKKYLSLHILIMILSSTSIGFKSYAFVILSVLYAVVLLREILKHKSFIPFIVGIIYSFLSFPFLWLITRFVTGSFFYEPLWFTDTMIESPDRVNYLEWKFLKDHYIFKKNWPRLWMLEAKKIAVFYFGNLGIRALFIGLPLFAIFEKYRKKVNWSLCFYLFIAFLFSTIFPLLFLQTGTVWNSIQFWYYGLLFANVLFVIFINALFENKSKVIFSLVFLLLFIISIPTTIKTFQEKNNKPFTLETEIIQELRALKTTDTILLCPEGSEVYHSAIVKVLTLARVYLANPSQLELVGSDVAITNKYEEIVSQGNNVELQKLIEKEKVTTILCSDRHLTNKFETMLSNIEEKVYSSDIESWKIIKL